MARLVFCCCRMACSSCHARTRLIATASTSSRMPSASRKLSKVDPLWSIFFFFLAFIAIPFAPFGGSGFFGTREVYHIRYIRWKQLWRGGWRRPPAPQAEIGGWLWPPLFCGGKSVCERAHPPQRETKRSPLRSP